MFRQRIKPSCFKRICNLVWPNSGWSRYSRYLAYRIARLPGTASSIASGFSIGAAVSFMPFIGFHFILAVILSILTRSNIVASLLGTIIGNPWTFPFIWLWIYTVGNWILGAQEPIYSTNFNMSALWDFIIIGMGYLGKGLFFNYWNIETQALLQKLWDIIYEMIFPMIIGCLPTSLIIWILFYFPIRKSVIIYRKNRINKKRRYY